MKGKESALRVLYTKHLTKKKRTYHDGYLLLSDGSEGLLLDDIGKKLGAGRIPTSSLPITAETTGVTTTLHDSTSSTLSYTGPFASKQARRLSSYALTYSLTTGLDCFDGFLVDCDELCSLEDLPNRSSTGNKENGTLEPAAPVAAKPVQVPVRAFKAVRPAAQPRRAAEQVRAIGEPVSQNAATRPPLLQNKPVPIRSGTLLSLYGQTCHMCLGASKGAHL